MIPWFRPLTVSLTSMGRGTRLGPYEVTAQIGKGRMGEVYRARDTKLDRDVALKILGGVRQRSGPARALRTRSEDLAALNHPDIAQIYGLELRPMFVR